MPDQHQTWPAVERRKNEQVDRLALQEKLDIALAEIQRLYGAAAATADAVTKAIPRQEAEDKAKERADEQKRLIVLATIAHFVLMLVAFWVCSGIVVARVIDQVDKDHDVIACLETTADDVKVAEPRAAVTDCVTTAKE